MRYKHLTINSGLAVACHKYSFIISGILLGKIHVLFHQLNNFRISNNCRLTIIDL